MSLPDAFIERLRVLIPQDRFDSVLQSFMQPRGVGIRVNTLKTSSQAMKALWQDSGVQVDAIPGMLDAYWAEPTTRSFWSHHDWVNQGLLYLQDVSSQAVAPILNPKPEEAVLDLCAAPGGKTTHLAALLQGHGDMGAVEAVRSRFFKLKANVDRMGAASVRLYHKDGRFIDKACPERFDAILLDAPCSTESCFHIDRPESYQYWGVKKIKAMAKKQRQLLLSALGALKPGGRLLYVTCSFAPEENECVLQHALDRFDGLTLLPIGLPECVESMPGLDRWQQQTFDPCMRHVQRLLPNALMRGLVLAMLHKSI